MLKNNVALWLKLELGENECFGVSLNIKGTICPECCKKAECQEELERKQNV